MRGTTNMEAIDLVLEKAGQDYKAQLEGLAPGEKAVIIYRNDDNDWTLLTQRRIIMVKDATRLELLYEDIAHVTYAMQEEAQAAPASFKGISKLALIGKNGTRYVILLHHFTHQNDWHSIRIVCKICPNRISVRSDSRLVFT